LIFILFLLALASLFFALMRPVATVEVPSNKAMIILAMDVSRSMCTTDISPNRLEAAKDAAQDFILNHNSGRQIGIVAFAGFAELIQPPTTDTGLLVEAVENLTTARRTAIGSAILRSIDAIAEIDDRILPSDNVSASMGIPEAASTEPELSPHIIVLLTDGASNAGPYPLTAATQAASRGIRVYTIGYGTPNNTAMMDCGDSFQEFNRFDFGNFGFGPQTGSLDFRLTIDEVTLQKVAGITGGEYYYASSASELENVLQNLPSFVIFVRETIEIAAYFNAVAVFIIIITIFLSLRWHSLS